jgi:hypothetical protein
MTHALVFLDCEFTDLLNPDLLSLGMVDLGGAEQYVELDLKTDVGRARAKASSEFVRWGGVLNLWGRVPGAACATELEMGQRTGEWLLGLAGESNARVEVAFDYAADYELMEHAIRAAGLWDRVREVVLPVNVNNLTGTIDGELAAEEVYRALSKRGLDRHHALADAHVLRAAYLTVKDKTLRLVRFAHSAEFRRFVAAVESRGVATTSSDFDAKTWVGRWLVREHPGLGGCCPLDLVDQLGGIETVERLLVSLLTSPTGDGSAPNVARRALEDGQAAA